MHMETKRLACGRSWQGTFPFPLFPIPFLSNGEIETRFITEVSCLILERLRISRIWNFLLILEDEMSRSH